MDVARDVLRTHPDGLSQSAFMAAIRAAGPSFRNEEGRRLLVDLAEEDPAVAQDPTGRYRMTERPFVS